MEACAPLFVWLQTPLSYAIQIRTVSELELEEKHNGWSQSRTMFSILFSFASTVDAVTLGASASIALLAESGLDSRVEMTLDMPGVHVNYDSNRYVEQTHNTRHEQARA
jgi:hypothetical protein